MRDLGDEIKRQAMLDVFRLELQRRNIPYVLVQGDWEERERIVTKAIKKLLR